MDRQWSVAVSNLQKGQRVYRFGLRPESQGSNWSCAVSIISDISKPEACFWKATQRGQIACAGLSSLTAKKMETEHRELIDEAVSESKLLSTCRYAFQVEKKLFFF